MEKEAFLDFITQDETWDIEGLLYHLGITWDKLSSVLFDCSDELAWSIKTEFKTIFISSGMHCHVPFAKTLYVTKKVNLGLMNKFKPVHCRCSLVP